MTPAIILLAQLQGTASTELCDASAQSCAAGPTATATLTAQGRLFCPVPLNATAAANHIEANATETSQSKCAKRTREAIEAGGKKLDIPKPTVPGSNSASAKDYGPSLEKAGFEPVANSSTYDPSAPVSNSIYHPQQGDVVVIQPYSGGKPHGHMQMYDGKKWTSDFTQRGFYPGSGYRQNRPPFVIYRDPHSQR